MSDEAVVIRHFSNEVEAEMAQEILLGAGISAFIFKDDAGGMEPHLQWTASVRLLVRRSDAERAREILEGLEQQPEPL